MKRSCGFSLLETTFATLLVSLLLVTSLSSLAIVIRTADENGQATTANNIGLSMLAEIASRAFSDPEDPAASVGQDGEPSDDRTQWDDCDDYHYWSKLSPKRSDGSIWPEADEWKTLAVTYEIDASDISQGSSGGNCRHLLVGEKSPTGKQFVFTAIKAEKGIGSQLAAKGASHVAKADIHAVRSGTVTQLSAQLTTDQVQP